MKLIDFLAQCKKLIDEDPNALQMEMLACHSASGSVDEVSNPFIREISYWDDTEFEVEEMLPRDYPFDSVIDVVVG